MINLHPDKLYPWIQFTSTRAPRSTGSDVTVSRPKPRLSGSAIHLSENVDRQVEFETAFHALIQSLRNSASDLRFF